MNIGIRNPGRHLTQGFSLIELMVTVGILGIVSTIAFSAYNDYLTSARISVMNDSIQTIRLLQDDRRLRLGEYVEGTYNPSNPDVSGGLKAVLGWDPRTENDVITYVVTCTTPATSPECGRTSGYTVTATHASGGDPITRTY